MGPGLAGLIIAAVGVAAAFALNVLSFLGVIFVVAKWKRPVRESKLPVETFRGATSAAVRYVRYSPGIRTLLLRSAFLIFFTIAHSRDSVRIDGDRRVHVNHRPRPYRLQSWTELRLGARASACRLTARNGRNRTFRRDGDTKLSAETILILSMALRPSPRSTVAPSRARAFAETWAVRQSG